MAGVDCESFLLPGGQLTLLLHVVGEQKNAAIDEECSQELQQTRARLLECQKENDKLREALQQNGADLSGPRQVRVTLDTLR